MYQTFLKITLLFLLIGVEHHVCFGSNFDQKLPRNNVDQLPIELKNQKDKQKFIREWLLSNYFKSNSISLQMAEEIDMKNRLTIFKIKLEGNFPNNFNNTYSVVYFQNLDKAFLIPIEQNQVFRLGHEMMIGGVYSYREFEYYFIYAFKANHLELRLDTRGNNFQGIKIGYLRDDDCVAYKPNRLSYHYLENQHSIEFSGEVYNFCKPRFDRDSYKKQPLSVEKANVVFRYINGEWIFDKGSTYDFW